jgi:lipooligosaccharide transport system permease protein
VLFSSVFPSMFGTFVKREFQHTYDAILAAPVDTEEIVTGESLWIAARAGTYGCMPLVVAMIFGLDPAWGMLTVPFIAFLTGFGWAAFGVLIAALMKSIDNFSYVTSIVITPLFLVAGTYFPIDGLPEWAQVLANLNPLYHCVELVRHAVFGFETIDLFHVSMIVAFAVGAAVDRLRPRPAGYRPNERRSATKHSTARIARTTGRPAPTAPTTASTVNTTVASASPPVARVSR